MRNLIYLCVYSPHQIHRHLHLLHSVRLELSRTTQYYLAKEPNRNREKKRFKVKHTRSLKMMMDRESLSEWAKDKPLSILQLDPADRAVLRIAGKSSQLPIFS